MINLQTVSYRSTCFWHKINQYPLDLEMTCLLSGQNKAHLQLLWFGVLGVTEGSVDPVVVFNTALGCVLGHGEHLPHQRQPANRLHDQLLQVVVGDLLRGCEEGREDEGNEWWKRTNSSERVNDESFAQFIFAQEAQKPKKGRKNGNQPQQQNKKKYG